MKKFILLPILLLAAMNSVNGKTAPMSSSGADSLYVFRFVVQNDMFYIPWNGNGEELARLKGIVEANRTDILEGRIPVRVNGYCTSMPTAAENLRTAALRSNRVKSELILHSGLNEACFVTRNQAIAYDNKLQDAVVVTLNVKAKDAMEQTAKNDSDAEKATGVIKEEPKEAKKETASEATPQQPATTAGESQSTTAPSRPYAFAVRTNLLYDAFLLPTLGVEWRINESVGIKLDGALSWWGTEHGRTQKMWLLNPEARWYLLHDKRFYLGISGNYGEYNVYEYPIGNLLRDDTGYQGKFWNAGITLGYQLPLSRHFAIDFNLGLGYSHSDYDSFGIERGTRIYKGRNCSKNIWGPTQAGINFVWTIGK